MPSGRNLQVPPAWVRKLWWSIRLTKCLSCPSDSRILTYTHSADCEDCCALVAAEHQAEISHRAAGDVGEALPDRLHQLVHLVGRQAEVVLEDRACKVTTSEDEELRGSLT